MPALLATPANELESVTVATNGFSRSGAASITKNKQAVNTKRTLSRHIATPPAMSKKKFAPMVLIPASKDRGGVGTRPRNLGKRAAEEVSSTTKGGDSGVAKNRRE